MVERTPISTNLLDPEIMKKWKAERKRFVVEGGKVAYIRTDPEFGDTPVLRKIGVHRKSDAVRRRNDIMKACARIIEEVFVDKEVPIRVPSKYGGEKKIIKKLTVVDGKVANREAVRAAFSHCLRAEAKITPSELKEKIKEYLKDAPTVSELVQKIRGEATQEVIKELEKRGEV